MKAFFAAALSVAVFAPLSADATNLAEGTAILSAIEKDEAKRKAYCELQDLLTKAEQAIEKRNEEEAKTLSGQAEAKTRQLGDDFLMLMALQINIDPATEEGRKYYEAWESLDKSCART